MSEEQPTAGELSRRIDALANSTSTSFADLNMRLNDFPTEKTLLALLQGSQAEASAHLHGVRNDVKDLDRHLSTEVSERKAAVKEVEDRAARQVSALEDRIRQARTITLTAFGIVGTLTLGVLTFVVQNLGGGA